MGGTAYSAKAVSKFSSVLVGKEFPRLTLVHPQGMLLGYCVRAVRLAARKGRKNPKARKYKTDTLQKPQPFME